VSQDPNAKIFSSIGSKGAGAYLNTILKVFGLIFMLVLTSHSCRHSAVDEANEHWQILIHWVIMRGDWVLDSISTFFEYASFSSKSDRKVARALAGWSMVNRGGLIAALDAISDVTVRAKIESLAKSIFAAPVPESMQLPLLMTLLMHYNDAKDLVYIIEMLEFKFTTFGITAEQMKEASRELKEDFILKNIESLPTENSGLPQSITTKLIDLESSVRVMQVHAAQSAQTLSTKLLLLRR
jgi:hypothetical protein